MRACLLLYRCTCCAAGRVCSTPRGATAVPYHTVPPCAPSPACWPAAAGAQAGQWLGVWARSHGKRCLKTVPQDTSRHRLEVSVCGGSVPAWKGLVFDSRGPVAHTWATWQPLLPACKNNLPGGPASQTSGLWARGGCRSLRTPSLSAGCGRQNPSDRPDADQPSRWPFHCPPARLGPHPPRVSHQRGQRTPVVQRSRPTARVRCPHGPLPASPATTPPLI